MCTRQTAHRDVHLKKCEKLILLRNTIRQHNEIFDRGDGGLQGKLGPLSSEPTAVGPHATILGKYRE